MNVTEELRLRAIRILHDGLHHSQEAIAWAARMVYSNTVPTTELEQMGFTDREISLGATPW